VLGIIDQYLLDNIKEYLPIQSNSRHSELLYRPRASWDLFEYQVVSNLSTRVKSQHFEPSGDLSNLIPS
jgi:hypothetical protein